MTSSVENTPLSRLGTRGARLSDHAQVSAVEQSPVILAERAVIGALLAENSLFGQVSGKLRADSFLDPGCAAVWCAIEEILTGRVDGVRVAEPMTVMVRPNVRNHTSVTRLEQLKAAANTDLTVVAGRVRVVAEFSTERALGTSIDQARKVLSDTSIDADQKAGRINTLINAVESRKADVISIGDLAESAIGVMMDKMEAGDDVRGVSTGFASLDDMTAGYHPGQMVVIAGRPSAGKTAFAFSSALHAARSGCEVMVASLEMSGQELSKRVISMVSGVDAHRLRTGALTEAEWEAVVLAVEDVKKLPLSILDFARSTMQIIAGEARRRKQDGRLGLLVIDYLQLLSGDTRKSRIEAVSEISREIKLLAKELDIPIITLSQLSRECEKRMDKRPMMSDLRESGAIEQDADVIMMLYRDEMYNPATIDTGIGEVNVVKQRSGPVGTVRVAFDGKTTTFSDIVMTPVLSHSQKVDPLAHVSAFNGGETSRPLRVVARP